MRHGDTAVSRRLLTWSLAVTCLVTTAPGCDSDAPSTSTSAPPSTISSPSTVSAERWVKYTGGAGGDSALLHGTVTERDGCLALILEGSDDREGVILAFEATDSRPEKLRASDEFEGTGGIVPVDPAAENPGFQIPESCGDAREWAVVTRGE